jgi:hypothetical protein
MNYIESVKHAFHPPGGWEEWNAETDTEGRIWDNGDYIGVSLQGSSKFRKSGKIAIDWKQNFDFWPMKVFECDALRWVHRGFFWKAMSVIDKAMDVADMEKPIKVFGFSQGAAVGQWFVAILTNIGIDVEGYFFGAPGIIYGDASDILYRCRQYEVRSDIVAKVPPMTYNVNRIWLKPKYKFWQVYKNHMSYQEY